MRFLFLLFIVVPIAEMFVLIKVGSAIGALPTILLVCLTAFIGVVLLRQQGFSALARAQQRMQGGQLPAAELITGVCLAAGGAMLLTPGFITDTFGFMLLIPATRHALLALLKPRFASHFQSSLGGSHQRPPPEQESASSTTIEGEFKREKDI